jgi:hypothetical protein
MRKKRFTVEQIVNLLRQVEVGVANGKTLLLMTQEILLIGHTQ